MWALGGTCIYFRSYYLSSPSTLRALSILYLDACLVSRTEDFVVAYVMTRNTYIGAWTI